MKSLDDRLSEAVERRDSLAVDLAKWDLEREANEHYKGFVVRARLDTVSNEAMKCNSSVHEEKVQKFPQQYIEFVKSLDEHMVRSNREMHSTFRVHFSDHFA